uniref:Putative secreted protein n=1 Tax=Anopheles darlingi TaxID=43151 RepID=A0A2M4D2K9_ANODA
MATLSVLSTKIGLFMSCISSPAVGADAIGEPMVRIGVPVLISLNMTPRMMISVGVVRTSRYLTSAMKTPGRGVTRPTLMISCESPSK